MAGHGCELEILKSVCNVHFSFVMLTIILQFHHRRNRNHGCGGILLVDGL